MLKFVTASYLELGTQLVIHVISTLSNSMNTHKTKGHNLFSMTYSRDCMYMYKSVTQCSLLEDNIDNMIIE